MDLENTPHDVDSNVILAEVSALYQSVPRGWWTENLIVICDLLSLKHDRVAPQFLNKNRSVDRELVKISNAHFEQNKDYGPAEFELAQAFASHLIAFFKREEESALDRAEAEFEAAAERRHRNQLKLCFDLNNALLMHGYRRGLKFMRGRRASLLGSSE